MYGDRIREKREEFGLSRKELAIRLTTSPQNIKLWEEELIAPTIPDLIMLATEFETTIDWLVGAVDDEIDADLDDEEHNCEDCDEFLECKLLPHMSNYMHNNDEAAYIHVQLAEDGKDEDCVIYAGNTKSVLSLINVLLKSISDESNIDYYDLVASMASAHARMELGGFFDEDE